MVRFIFGCAFVLALTILATPIYYGVSQEKSLAKTPVTSGDVADVSLTFEEIYEIAGADRNLDPASLNDITPAAGNGAEDKFSSGFQNIENPALADTPEIIKSDKESSEL